jgi:vancomycin resistance protein YoaR
MRQTFQNFLLQAMPGLVKAGMFTPEMFDYLPMPYKVRQSIIQSMQAQQKNREAQAAAGISTGGRGPVRDPKETAAKIMDIQARAAVLQARAVDIPHKAKRDDFKAMMEAMAQRHEHQSDKVSHALDFDRADREQSRHKLEEDKALADFAVKLLGARNSNTPVPSAPEENLQSAEQ